MKKSKQVAIFRHNLYLALNDYTYAELILLRPILDDTIRKIINTKKKELKYGTGNK